MLGFRNTAAEGFDEIFDYFADYFMKKWRLFCFMSTIRPILFYFTKMLIILPTIS